MLFMAQVLDVSEFFSTGKIKVRIDKNTNSKMSWDMGAMEEAEREKYIARGNVSELNGKIVFGSTEGTIVGTNDDYAWVYTPIGGGKNYGLLFLPKKNTRGVVSTLENKNEYVWMGSIYDGFSSFSTEDFLNVPSDKLENEGNISVKKSDDGSIDNFDGDENTLVLRLKSTSENNVGWEKNPTENLFVVDKDRIQVRHVNEWKKTTTGSGKSEVTTFELKKYKELFFTENETGLKSINNDSKIHNDISIVDDEIVASSKLYDKDGKITRSSEINMSVEDSARISLTTNPSDDVFCTIGIEDQKIILTVNKNSTTDTTKNPMVFEMDFSANQISLNAEKIVIGSEGQVTIGTGLYNILATTTDSPIKVETTVLVPIKKIKVG